MAEASGSIQNSFLQLTTANEGCELGDAALAGGQFVFSVMGEGGPGPIAPVEGVIGGKIGETVPSVVLKQPTSPTLFANWSATSKWLIESKAGVRARPWDLSELVTVYDPGQDPEKLPSHNPFGIGSAVFTEVGSGSYWGVMSWDPVHGLRPLLRAFGDGTQGFGNFMTDGVDMVWTHGTGKSAPGGTPTYPSYDIWTAPFTTDPAVVATNATRLRSDLYGLVPTPFGVGCGYAARTVPTDWDSGVGFGSWDLLVVRLKDGTSWLTDGPDFSTGMGFTAVLGLTCEEVFATAQFPDDKSTIVRVRLDSLGPGIPPD